MYFNSAMPNPYDVALRERAVHAYVSGEGSYRALAALFDLDHGTLERWVARWRTTHSVAPEPKGGGWRCPIDMRVLHAVVRDGPDATLAELCWEDNRRVPKVHRTTRASFHRALMRADFVHKKKRPRASEVDRPDVARKRAAFVRWVRRQDPNRLVFIDEAGANLAMGRSHVWVKRGHEYVEPRPMNWGDNLTLVGAIRRSGWVTMNTKWRAMNRLAFIAWVQRRLAPRLQVGDIVLLDNLQAHKAPEVRFFIEQRGARLRLLPPYSHDFNPIESAWALVKKRIRDGAPRTGTTLRRVVRYARYAVTPYHCHQFFAHAGYGNSSGHRG